MFETSNLDLQVVYIRCSGTAWSCFGPARCSKFLWLFLIWVSNIGQSRYSVAGLSGLKRLARLCAMGIVEPS